MSLAQHALLELNLWRFPDKTEGGCVIIAVDCVYASLSALSCKPTKMTGVGGGGGGGGGGEGEITPERLRNRSMCTVVTRCQHVFEKWPPVDER